MKMKELERKTGVSREAIRYYIREGLVPEPERPKKNVARYDDVHAAAITSIKHLQDERGLPLDVIKPMLRSKAAHAALRKDAFPGLADALETLLVQGGAPGALPLDLAAEAIGLDVSALEALGEAGLLDIQDGEEPAQRLLAPSSLPIARQWAALRNAGFKSDDGFGPDTAKLYADFVSWIADQEISRFFGNLAGELEPGDAADMASSGIILVNELLAMLRTQALVKRLRSFEAEKPKKVKEKKT